MLSIESSRAARPETASTLDNDSCCQFNHSFCFFFWISTKSSIQLFHRIHALSTSWKFAQYTSFFAARTLRELSITPNLTIPALIACRWGWGIVRLVRPRSCALIIVLLLTHSLTGSKRLAEHRLNGGITQRDPILIQSFSRTTGCAAWCVVIFQSVHDN